MAHTFEIAIEFEGQVGDVVWSKGKGIPSSWRASSNFPELEITMTHPRKFAGMKIYVGSEAIPLQLHTELLRGTKRLSVISRRTELEFVVAQRISTKRHSFRRIDPWVLREELLSLKRSTGDLVRFLRKCGEWSENTEVGARFFNTEPRMRLCLAETFWTDRQKIIDAMEAGPSAFDRSPYFSDFQLDRRAAYPHLVLRDSFCLDSILHSVVLDLLRGVEFRLCARQDCRTPFPVASNHGKMYCEQYCGHLVSVRKKRDKDRLKGRGKFSAEVNHVAL